MKSAYLYTRVSTDEQKRKGNSLIEQEDRLVKHCEIDGIQIKGIYREDYSAKDFNREERQSVKEQTGRPRKYTPARLWKKALEYFEWNEKNPLYETKAFANDKTKQLPKLRAMTESAFCLYAGISHDLFLLYKKGADPYKDFIVVSGRIATIIYIQKLEGAAADLFNANIIARELGLQEKITAQFVKVGKDLADETYE